jgi:homoserine kinase
VIVRVPGSSANLGPGFDALGMALTVHFELVVGDDTVPSGIDIERHPAVVAFRRLGGEGPVGVRTAIPMGRGLGFSGAARVAGLVAALAQRSEVDFDLEVARGEVLVEATALEGHADNVAASLYGGVIATAGGEVVQIPLAFDPVIVVWVPNGVETSTDSSRRKLPATVSLDDAAFNIGRTALLVAALASGRVDSLREATADRLHQDIRFEAVPSSRRALYRALDAEAMAGWLSGSGPTVATMCSSECAEQVAAAMSAEGDGHSKVLRIDHVGTTIEH